MYYLVSDISVSLAAVWPARLARKVTRSLAIRPIICTEDIVYNVIRLNTEHRLSIGIV